MKYAIVTFGCRVNQADSLRLEEALRRRGAEAAPPEAADLVLVNTCSVTASADQGTRQAIRRIARLNPSARIVATGCQATRAPDEMAALGVWRVVPNADKDDLVGRLAPDLGLSTAERFGRGDGPCGLPLAPGTNGRTTYTLRLQTGCEAACAYCIIPATRGPNRSAAPALVLEQVDRIARAGFREVVLTGVHLGAYGRDLRPPTRLIDLLERLAASPGDVTFRVSSLEPMDCPPELVELVAGSPRFAPHFHLPLQHGSDRMLERMRRPYTVSCYRALVASIRARLPHASIGADVIAGFPGETAADHAATLQCVRTSPLTHLHVFPYSDRPGTVASTMPGKVPAPDIRARGDELRAEGRRLAACFRQSQVRTVRPGLTTGDGTLVLTDNFLKVRVPRGRSRNERVRVRITAAGEPMRGELVPG